MQAVAAPFALASAGLQAIGAIRQGNSQAQASNYNANLADINATLADQQTAENVRRQREANAKTLGKIRANYSASGVTLDGSPLDVLEESARTAEMDALTTQYQGQQLAWSYRNSADLYRRNASQARTGGFIGAAAALLKGGASYAALSSGDAGPSKQLLKYRGMATQAYENPDI